MDELLSRVGIGAATVDTKLPDTLTAGEAVSATVEVSGGKTDQDVEAVYFALCTEYATDEGRERTVLDRTRLADSFTIEAGEERAFDVDLPVPRHTPVSVGRTSVWVDTGLDVDWALDPDDRDHVDVRPGPRLDAVLSAMDDLGFRLRTAEPKRVGSFAGRSFLQEFEFRPESGRFAGALDEVELACEPREDRVNVHLEVDQRGGLLSEAMDVDERYDSVAVTTTDTDAVREELEARIEQNA